MNNNFIKAAVLLTVLLGYPCLRGMGAEGKLSKIEKTQEDPDVSKDPQTAEKPQEKALEKQREEAQKQREEAAQKAKEEAEKNQPKAGAAIIKGLQMSAAGAIQGRDSEESVKIQELQRLVEKSTSGGGLTEEEQQRVQELRIDFRRDPPVGFKEYDEGPLSEAMRRYSVAALAGRAGGLFEQGAAVAIAGGTVGKRPFATAKTPAGSIAPKSKFLPPAAVGIGAVLLAIVAAIVGGVVGEEESRDKDKITAPTDVGGGDEPALPDTAVIMPSPYAEAAPDNEDHQNNLLLIANTFNRIEDKFKASLDSGDYYSPKFRITLGQVTIKKTIEVAIEYDFIEGGAGDLTAPLTPIEVKMIPADIDGAAINLDTLISQIRPENQELAKLLIKPNAAFLFLLKIILLNKSVFKDPEYKDHSERIREILTQSSLLCFRLQKNTTPLTQPVISGMPKSVREYLDGALTKMYPELIKSAESSDRSLQEIMNALLNIRTSVADYNERTKAMQEAFLPLFNDSTPYAGKKLFVHAILRHISDIGDNMREINNELVLRAKDLVLLIQDAVKIMKDSGFDEKDISQLEAPLSVLQKIQKGATKIDVKKIIKPRIGEPKSGIQDISLTSALDVYFDHFKSLGNVKFIGDYGFIQSDLLLGSSETVDAILAVFLRGVDMVSRATKALQNSKELMIELRTSTGTLGINPTKELDKLTSAQLAALQQAVTSFVAAGVKLKADSENPANKTAYDKAKLQLDKAKNDLNIAMQNFREAYSPYLPMKLDDGSEKTPLEFVKDGLKSIQKVGHKNVFTQAVFKDLFAVFKKPLGLTIDKVINVSALPK